MKPLLILGALYLAYRAYASANPTTGTTPATGSTGTGTGTGTGTTTGGTTTGTTGSTLPTGSANAGIVATSEQEAESRILGWTNTAEMRDANSVMRRGMLPDGSSPEVYRRWLGGDPSLFNDYTYRYAVVADYLPLTAIRNARIMMGYDQWNAYREAQTGVAIPPAVMDTIPAAGRWAPVSIDTYLSWIGGQAGLNGFRQSVLDLGGLAWLQ